MTTANETTVQFFLPETAQSKGPLPNTLEAYWEWVATHGGIGEIGKYTWTLKTYLYLKQSQVPVRLVTTFPSEGIVVSHRDFLPLHLRPRVDVFLVCIKPDRKEHTWAHHYIVQNRNDRIFSGPLAGRASHVLHWPQPHLVPRRRDRGARVEHIRYFGRALNLASELESPAWAERLRAAGFAWSVVPSSKWNDYSDCDVTVSVREFGESGAGDPLMDPDSKPPSKLINSWLAGVPAIVGRESAFRSLRQSPLDFLEVNDVDELFAALEELRRNADLHQAMAAHGRERSWQFTEEAIVALWVELVRTEVVPAYERWMRKGRLRRQALNLGRTARYLANPANLAAIRIYRPSSDGRA